MKGIEECYPKGMRRINLKSRLFSSKYNAMIHPYIRHTIKGVISYLGELKYILPSLFFNKIGSFWPTQSLNIRHTTGFWFFQSHRLNTLVMNGWTQDAWLLWLYHVILIHTTDMCSDVQQLQWNWIYYLVQTACSISYPPLPTSHFFRLKWYYFQLNQILPIIIINTAVWPRQLLKTGGVSGE